VVSAAILRPLWLTRNDFIFNKPVWRDQKMILAKAISLLRGEPRMQELKSSWKWWAGVDSWRTRWGNLSSFLEDEAGAYKSGDADLTKEMNWFAFSYSNCQPVWLLLWECNLVQVALRKLRCKSVSVHSSRLLMGLGMMPISLFWNFAHGSCNFKCKWSNEMFQAPLHNGKCICVVCVSHMDFPIHVRPTRDYPYTCACL
jgi:hypothetical protein